ncbi:MAG: RDD family protein [Nanoarchaeota archaeon]
MKTQPNNEAAPIWKRTIAFVVDIIIVRVIATPIYDIIEKRMFLGEPPTSLSAMLNAKIAPIGTEITLLTALVGLITLAYFVFMEKMLQQTIGKMILKIKITSQTGTMEWWQVIVRNLTKAFSLFLPFFLLADFVYLLFKKTQKFTDILSKTEVTSK